MKLFTVLFIVTPLIVFIPACDKEEGDNSQSGQHTNAGSHSAYMTSVPGAEYPSAPYNYILHSYMKVGNNSYDGLYFGTHKRFVKRDLESRAAIQSIKNGILYSVDEHNSYDLATYLTFIDNKEFVAARSFIMADDLDPQFNYSEFTQDIKRIIAKEHGAPWERVNDPESDGYYISWKTKDYYLNISYTPRKWSRGSIVPIDFSVYWTTGTTDQAFRSEMKSQHGY